MRMKANDLILQTKEAAGCLLFVVESKKFLLIQRSDFVPMPLTWCLPGGGVNVNEQPNVAAKRELYEEVGYELKEPMHLIYTNETHAPRFKFYTYAALVDKPFKPRLNWESINYGWHTVDDLPSPLHWGLEQLFSSERAAKKLKNLSDIKVEKDLFQKK